MRISDWSSDVCSSDLAVRVALDEVRARYGNRIASVIHLAAYYDISGDPNPLYDQVTVQGTRRLIDGLQSFEVEQFVFASTMLVHKPTATPDEIGTASCRESVCQYLLISVVAVS